MGAPKPMLCFCCLSVLSASWRWSLQDLPAAIPYLLPSLPDTGPCLTRETPFCSLCKNVFSHTSGGQKSKIKVLTEQCSLQRLNRVSSFTFANFWGLLAFIGLWQHLRCVSVCPRLPLLSCIKTLIIGFRAHLIQDDFLSRTLTNYICRALFPNQDTFQGSRETAVLERHYSTH